MRSHSGTSFVALAILVMLLVPADAVLAGQAQSSNRSALDPASAPPAYRDATQPVTKRVKDLLGRMTLEEKIGQMTQAERGAVADDPTVIAAAEPGLGALRRRLDPDAEHAWRPGSTWSTRSRSRRCSTRLGIPIIYGIDAVHGHGNVFGATVFPHNIGLGATRDPALVRGGRRGHRRGGARHRHPVDLRAVRLRRPGRALGPHLRELRRGPRVGVQDGDDHRRPPGPWASADLAATTCWPPRSTTPATATPSTTPPWPLPTSASRGTSSVHDRPGRHGHQPRRLRDDRPGAVRRRRCRRHDVGSVMPSFSSVDWTEDGVGNPVKMHAHEELITDVLKGRFGLRRLRHLATGRASTRSPIRTIPATVG